MGLLEKVKNMFTEEVEDDDVKVEQIKKEVTHVAIESPGASNTSRIQEEEPDINFEFKTEESISKPIFFDDNDFKDLNLVEEPEEEKEEVKPKEVYGSRISVEKEPEVKKIFKPTPIISPVYGVLDKNYHKEDIVSRTDVRPPKESKPSPIDEVRNKAYGTLEDELENTLFGSNSILFKKEEKEEEKVEIKEVEEDLLSSLTDDISKELDEILEKKEKYIDEDDDLKNNVNEEDLLGFIDSTLYREGDE